MHVIEACKGIPGDYILVHQQLWTAPSYISEVTEVLQPAELHRLRLCPARLESTDDGRLGTRAFRQGHEQAQYRSERRWFLQEGIVARIQRQYWYVPTGPLSGARDKKYRKLKSMLETWVWEAAAPRSTWHERWLPISARRLPRHRIQTSPTYRFNDIDFSIQRTYIRIRGEQHDRINGNIPHRWSFKVFDSKLVLTFLI